ncbi:MAG: hypothetical protein H0X24_00460 [Ktedonobacterales bacterium]|nr:hypothetical protein [Ktedonobacterales bacterium]
MIAGFPWPFFVPLVIHALAGLTTVVMGILTFTAPKQPGRHPTWGVRYLWAYTVVFFTATLLAIQRWPADAYLLGLATVGYGAALGSYGARRYRLTGWMQRWLGNWWVVAHLCGMIGSYVVLLTAFYVDNAHLIPLLQRLPVLVFWVMPTLITLPFLVRALRRFAPRQPTSYADG